MIIDKNGFYIIDDSVSEIFISSGLDVTIFNSFGKLEKVVVEKNTKLYFCGILEKASNNIYFDLIGEKSDISIKYFVLGNSKIKSKIFSDIKKSYLNLKVNILSFIFDDGDIDLDGCINISKGLSSVAASLHEENIFLGTSGKIKGVPSLFVKSNDVEAKHGLKVERINDEDLFYFRSRGLSQKSSLKLLLEGKISAHLSFIEKFDNNLYLSLKISILNKIIKK